MSEAEFEEFKKELNDIKAVTGGRTAVGHTSPDPNLIATAIKLLGLRFTVSSAVMRHYLTRNSVARLFDWSLGQYGRILLAWPMCLAWQRLITFLMLWRLSKCGVAGFTREFSTTNPVLRTFSLA
jgi:hypothetical protein